MSLLITMLIAVISALAAGVLVYWFARITTGSKLANVDAEVKRILDAAHNEAEAKKREALLEAKEESHRIRSEIERETRDRRAELQQIEKRLMKKEESLDRKIENLEKKEEQILQREGELDRSREALEEVRSRQMVELERISGMSREEAREILLAQVREESQREAALILRQSEMAAREEAEQQAREIIGMAIQRCAADHSAEISVSVVPLPNEEMKGRIIGREGRNIRTFEALTGVDVIIDDTPEAVVISAFDPVRREKARLALTKLLADGRIHPARIEEMYDKADREVEGLIRTAGEQACIEAGVHGLHPEMQRILGRLKYRTSYGQNVLNHSIEVAHLAALMATMLGADVNVARRAGLLHDLGKAVDHDQEGTHVTIGMELMRRYGESQAVIHAMSTHHGEFEAESVEAVLVAASDALSAARPGARRETLETYIKRLEKLEEIARSFEGVEKSFAIQAGREIRIVVKPEQVDDLESYRIAKEISKRIENEMQYPGQIKVTVIRETRAIEFAR